MVLGKDMVLGMGMGLHCAIIHSQHHSTHPSLSTTQYCSSSSTTIPNIYCSEHSNHHYHGKGMVRGLRPLERDMVK